jgi:hypothetical protein
MQTRTASPDFDGRVDIQITQELNTRIIGRSSCYISSRQASVYIKGRSGGALVSVYTFVLDKMSRVVLLQVVRDGTTATPIMTVLARFLVVITLLLHVAGCIELVAAGGDGHQVDELPPGCDLLPDSADWCTEVQRELCNVEGAVGRAIRGACPSTCHSCAVINRSPVS